jgi:hypothetical protein
MAIKNMLAFELFEFGVFFTISIPHGIPSAKKINFLGQICTVSLREFLSKLHL